MEDGTGSIDACVISKRYGNYGEERNWTATHNVRIDLEDFVITGFDVEDRVFGDEGLGDYDPSDVFSRAAYFDQSECFVRKLLAKAK